MQDDSGECDALRSFSRPRYFYGQLLDVRHFEAEQAYFKRKQWMRNRLVDGFGVVCGLDVHVAGDGRSVVVMPGVALDRQGREIVVPVPSKPLLVPGAESGTDGQDGGERKGDCCDDWMRLVICYQECKTDPEPVMTAGCDTTSRCAPGAIREGYSLSLQPGAADPIAVDSRIERVIKGNCVDYRALVEWISAPCDCSTGPACITLANIRLPEDGQELTASHIDISVRPIVYSLDLLWEMMLALSHETPSRRNGKN